MPKIAAAPKTINTNTRIIFKLANQNSLSAKNLTEKALKAKIVTPKMTLQIYTEISGNHRCISNPTAVNSDPTVTTQLSQYIIPTAKPAPGLIKRVAYS